LGKLRKPPTVFKGSHRQRSGEIVSDKQYSFRVQYQGKRKTIKTEFKNKKKAQEYVDSIFSSETKFEKFLKEQFGDEKIDYIQEDLTSNEQQETVLEVLKRQGWLNWETNPKRLSHLRQQKNYGSRQAKKLAFALNHMFVDSKKYSWFSEENLRSIKREDAQRLSSELWRNRTHRGAICENSIELKDVQGDYHINIIALKTFFTYCYSELAIIESNPFQPIKIPKQRQSIKKYFFSQQELRMMFNKSHLESFEFSEPKEAEKWEDFLQNDYLKSFFFTALTGLRSGEVRALRTGQIRNDIVLEINRAFKENTTKESDVDTPKWGKERTIVLCDSAYGIIKKRMRKEDNGYIFTNSIGKAINASDWNKKFKYFISVLYKFNLLLHTNYTPHCFRGTLNSILLKENIVSESLIRSYLGWTSNNPLSVVQDQHYTGFSDSDLKKVAEGIELIFSGKEMKFELIGEDEIKEFLSMVFSSAYTKSVFNPESSVEADTRLKVLNAHKNYIFKHFNNYIIYAEGIDETIKEHWITHCKNSIGLRISKIADLDTMFPIDFKKFLSPIMGEMDDMVKESFSMMLDMFAEDYLKKKRREE